MPEWTLTRALILSCLVAATACERAPVALRSEPLPQREAESFATRFERLAPEQTGIDFIHRIEGDHPMRRLYHSGYASGGIAVGDVDGDALPDVFLTSGPGSNKLYRQQSGMRFEDITRSAGIELQDIWSTGAAMVDIDGDSDLDIYVSNYDAPNHLYVNRGDGRFDERAAQFGLDLVDASLMSVFADYDADGDLDVYLLTNRFYREGGRPSTPPIEMRNGVPMILPEYRKYYGLKMNAQNQLVADSVGRPDRLLRNDGNRFTDVSKPAGISSAGSHGLAASWWDYDDDGDVDLYVGSDFDDPDHLYRNEGDGTFRDVIREAIPHTSWFSMGSEAADINNDGRLDYLSVDMSATTHYMQKVSMGAMSAERLLQVAGPPPQLMRNALYLNSGAGRFMEAAYLAGVADSDWSWAVKFGDLDEDGRVDLFISNGSARNFNHSDTPITLDKLIGKNVWDLFADEPTRPERNLALRNRDFLDFEDRGADWGLDHVGMSYAAAFSDLDRDGDLDLLVMNLDEPLSVYRNRSAGNHRVVLQLEGTASNRLGLGARIRLETDAGVQVRELGPHNGFLSSNEPIFHFGLGEQTAIDALTVRWPSGRVQRFHDLKADQRYVVREPALELPATESGGAPATTAPQPLFTASKAVDPVRHRERRFDDFERQPLLPNKLSQLGPGLAVGDADGDGREDLFVGGALGESGDLRLNDGAGRFVRTSDRLPTSRDHEDMGALFFDADGDGDQDLYTASGGVEAAAGDASFADRLYLNDGKGRFELAPAKTLPSLQESSGVVAAADYDGDGDLDLFIGSRSVPGDYPRSPESHLLRNERGRFEDVTREVAPGLLRAGMVTGALWSDADGDGRSDLLLTTEWGPVRLFANEGLRLVERTGRAGSSERTGWWNGISGRDVDHDGDIDYVVTNFGLNTKYHASEGKPASLYYGDLAGDGGSRMVEAEYEGDTEYPVRGRSCSSGAMPFIAEKFPTFEAFARAGLDAIIPKSRLESALRLEVNTLESGLLLNDGSGRFAFRALPRLAQIAPAFGVLLTEVDGDGHPDLYLAQNFFTPQLETGPMDGGLSLLLLGDGAGNFEPIWPARSGLVVPGDATAVAALDLNDDGWTDFAVAQNDAPLLAFENTGGTRGNMFAVRLRGTPGNPTGVGSRVTVQLLEGSTQTAEVYAGGGYLAQSSATLRFGTGSSSGVANVEVRWPDGTLSTVEPPHDASAIEISQRGSFNAAQR